MARNYSLAEAVDIIVKGKDMEAIADIGRRYPILAVKISALAAIAGEQFNEFMSYIPEHISANKVNSIIKIKKDIEGSDNANDAPDPDEVEGKSVKNTDKKEAVEDTDDGTDYDSMSGKELWDLLGKKGLRNKCKEKYGTKKADLIKFLKELDAEGEDTDGDVEDDDAEAKDYSKMTAPELFKECKKRGIKAEMKKPAKYYITLLKKDDQAKDNSDDDEWDEDATEEEKKPVKKQEKATEKKAAKKEAAKEEDDDDDDNDEDWDI